MLTPTTNIPKRVVDLEKAVYGPYLDVNIEILDNIPANTPISIQTPSPTYSVAAPSPGFRNLMNTADEFNRNAKLQVFLCGIPQSKMSSVFWVSPTSIRFTGPLYTGMKIKIWFTPLSEDIHLTGVGPSAYQIALNNGFVGTEAQWLLSLEGSDAVLNAQNQDTPLGIVDTVNILGDATGVKVGSRLDIYVNAAPTPFSITSFSNTAGANLEIGQSITNFNLNWVYSHSNANATAQSIDQGIGAIGLALRTVLVPGPITTNTTYTLSATKVLENDSAQTSLTFRAKRYWGTSASADPMGDGINTFTLLGTFLDSVNEELATTRQTTKIFDCSAGRYFYFFFPTAWGTADPQLQIGPFPVSLSYTGTITNFTNQSGYSQDYYVYRSDNLLFDSSVVVTVL